MRCGISDIFDGLKLANPWKQQKGNTASDGHRFPAFC
jgi:hypothetical protein